VLDGAEAVAPGLEGRQQPVVDRGRHVAREQDEVLVAQIVRREALLAGERALDGDEREDRVPLEQRFALEPGLVDRHDEDPDVELAGAQPRELLVAVQMADARRRARMALVQRGEEPLECRHRAIRHEADPQRVGRAGNPLDLLDRRVELGEDRPGALGEDLSGLGRHDSAARPQQQVHAELLLELGDRLRERRLRHVEPLGGATEVLLLHHREEVAQMPQLDRADHISKLLPARSLRGTHRRQL
jgi:hypothetical protein